MDDVPVDRQVLRVASDDWELLVRHARSERRRRWTIVIVSLSAALVVFAVAVGVRSPVLLGPAVASALVSIVAARMRWSRTSAELSTILRALRGHDLHLTTKELDRLVLHDGLMTGDQLLRACRAESGAVEVCALGLDTPAYRKSRLWFVFTAQG